MKLRVKDIVKIWNNGAASLVAGQEGLMRRIEVFDMMEQPNIKPWLREHLLLITTGYVIRNDKEALLNLILVIRLEKKTNQSLITGYSLILSTVKLHSQRRQNIVQPLYNGHQNQCV